MKVTVPETQKDITLRQFQEYDLVDKKDIDALNNEALKIFLNLKDAEISLMSQNDKDNLISDLTKAMNTAPVFDVKKTPTFDINGVTFGFHPNINNLESGAYHNLLQYTGDVQDYHKLMTILFRPITGKDFLGNYKIAEFNGSDEWGEVMKETPLHIFNSALFFFQKLAQELLKHTQKFSQVAELVKGNRLPNIGVAMG